VAYFYNGKIRKQIENKIAQINPDAIHCHLIRTTEYIKNVKNIPKSLDFMDAFGIGMEKRQNTERNFGKRLLFAYEKNRLYKYEKQVFSFVDWFCIISEQDRDSIKSKRKGEIKIIPNGVDFDAFYPRNEKKKYDIVFMGNMGYPPNIAAVQFLASEIMPLVIIAKPTIKLLVAGVGAPKSIKMLHSKNIDVIENFEHISDSIAISKIMLAPMQISIGLQNKILQAMAMKTPCIVSPASNNAIKAPNDFAIVEASSPTEYAEVIIDLLDKPLMAAKIGKNGYDFVKENFSWPAQNKLLEDLILTGFERNTT
jgi:glycosyltransferase involved in cell wall biosynthesis